MRRSLTSAAHATPEQCNAAWGVGKNEARNEEAQFGKAQFGEAQFGDAQFGFFTGLNRGCPNRGGPNRGSRIGGLCSSGITHGDDDSSSSCILSAIAWQRSGCFSRESPTVYLSNAARILLSSDCSPSCRPSWSVVTSSSLTRVIHGKATSSP